MSSVRGLQPGTTLHRAAIIPTYSDDGFHSSGDTGVVIARTVVCSGEHLVQHAAQNNMIHSAMRCTVYNELYAVGYTNCDTHGMDA
jgi:hypothetical protein